MRRYVNLVYSAALRMVCRADLAQEVTQGVFVALARDAAHLSKHPVLSSWLHRTTRNIAAQAVRTEVRRRKREQEAAAMNEMLSDQPEAVWAQVAPLLDAALDGLSEPDRDAVLLRYFERKSASEMAQTLGISEEAAQKRVGRAVERLREFFAKNGVTVGASGLVVSISANAVQAAPAGLAASISTAALAGATLVSTTTATVATTIAITMTTMQKLIVATAITAVAGVAIYEARQASNLREQNQALLRQQAASPNQAQQPPRTSTTEPKRTAAQATTPAKKSPSEVSKLRAQVEALRDENATIKNKSALSKVTADPETRKLMREQQKMGMSFIYSDLAKQLKLTPEMTGKLNDLLADHVMDCIDTITQSLQNHASSTEIDLLFGAEDLVLHEKVSALLGSDGLAQYKYYSQNLIGGLTVQQFANNLTGDTETKAVKRNQLLQAMLDENQAALAAAGLPANYQTVPMLNFRNIASEEIGDRSLSLMESIYNHVAARANTFLTAEELTKFQEFGKTGVQNSRAALMMNRKLMAPISQ